MNRRADADRKNETINDRLETVRVEVHDRWGDFKDFWRSLQGPDYEISYNGARNYHFDDRDVPASYLARVCEVHGVNPDFLLLGQEPVMRRDRTTEATLELLTDVDSRLQEAATDVSHLRERLSSHLGAGERPSSTDG